MPVPQSTVEQENELAKARRLSEYRKVRDAFLAVFGPAGKRTPHGAVILDELERFSNYRKPIDTMDSTGRLDTHRYMIAMGRREVVQAIYNAIDWRESDHVNPSSGSTQ